MAAPEDVTLDFATRLVVHEILLQKLFLNYLQLQPDPQERMDTLRNALVTSMEFEHLTHGHGPMDTRTEAFSRSQSAWGQELANKFVDKLERAFE